MRALVIGASGQVGNALCAALISRGHAVAGTYRRTGDPSRRFVDAFAAARSSSPALWQLDVTDHAGAARLVADVRPEWVFCPAGLTHVDYCEDHPEEAARVNRDAPAALARAAAAIGAGFVWYSSDYVFDGRAGPYAEGDAPNPLSVYGRTKLEGERAVLDASPRALVVRSTGVYGPEPQEKNFVYQLLRRLGAGQRMPVPGDQVSTPTYNRDLAAASVMLAEREAHGIYHVAGPSLLDRHAFAVLAAGIFALDATLVVAAKTADLGQRAARPLRGGLRVGRVAEAVTARLLAPVDGLAAMREAIAPSQR
jgi:dTDP-4-dehydrorhamnose reductase